MKTFNVYGVSHWPESLGERFPIFLSKPFESEASAITAARSAYSDDLVVEVVEVKQEPASPKPF